MDHKEKRRILIALGAMTCLLLALVVYLTYFQVTQAEEIKKSAYNKRNALAEEKVVRGSIYSRDGQLLAYTDEESKTRMYPFNQLYSHILGYHSSQYGKAGLELMDNDLLLNRYESETITAIRNYIQGYNQGNNVHLTIDHGLQQRAAELLGQRKGAIVAMNPQNGEILCMVSYPDFNPNTVDQDWEMLNQSEDSPLINRCTQGLYEPGSTFKVISAAVQLEQLGNRDETYQCQGSQEVGGYTFTDYGSQRHGEVTLDTAFAKSCNTYFAYMSTKLNKSDYIAMAEKVFFNKKIPLEVPVAESRMRSEDIKDKTALASSSIGQGNVLATPMNILLMTSAVANDGVLMQPHVIKEVEGPSGKIHTTNVTEIHRVIDSSTVSVMKEIMRKVVTEGTGTQAGISAWHISGKTGTAENATGKSHAWFTGFGPYDNPEIAITIVLEESGSGGGTVAAPIARELFQYMSQRSH